MTTARFYTPPNRERHRLDVEPALASWDRPETTGQLRSQTFIEHACSLVSESIAAVPDPLALRLDVGLPESVSLLALHDLDNYLFPLVPILSKRTGRQFASVWATKRHAAESFIQAGPTEAVPEATGGIAFDVHTSASSGSTEFKEQIRDQITSAEPLPDGGVALQIGFVVGPTRAWPNLWKPTIDALGRILGHDEGAREWNARDGRITELGLHCVVDPSRRYEIGIAIRAAMDGG